MYDLEKEEEKLFSTEDLTDEQFKRSDMLSYAGYIQSYIEIIVDPRRNDVATPLNLFEFCNTLKKLLNEDASDYKERIQEDPERYSYWKSGSIQE
jgi:hypothetical protein